MKKLNARALSTARSLAARLREIDLQDLALAAGFGALVRGVFLVYVPAGWIAAGLQCYLVAWLIERDRARAAAAKGKK